MRKFWIGVAAVASMAASVLPSGAGQHFGVAGDFIAFPAAASATNGPAAASATNGPAPESSADGFFAWGLSAGVTETSNSRTVHIDTFTGCVAVHTPQGSDFGCVHDFRLPPSLSDPAMRNVMVQGAAPSERYPGSIIMFTLQFVATGEPAPGEGHSTSTDPNRLRIGLRAGLATSVIVSGSVRSPVVGEALINDGSGIYARGVVIDVCQYDGQPCPPPGTNG